MHNFYTLKFVVCQKSNSTNQWRIWSCQPLQWSYHGCL